MPTEIYQVYKFPRYHPPGDYSVEEPNFSEKWISELATAKPRSDPLHHIFHKFLPDEEKASHLKLAL